MRQGELLTRITEVRGATLRRLSEELQQAQERVCMAGRTHLACFEKHAELRSVLERVRLKAVSGNTVERRSALAQQCEHRYELELLRDLADAENRTRAAKEALANEQQQVAQLREQITLLSARLEHAKAAIKKARDAEVRSLDLARDEEALEAWAAKPRCL